MYAGSNPCRNVPDNGYNYEPRNGLCAAIDQQYGTGLLRSSIDLRRASPATVQAWQDDDPAAGGTPDSAEQSPESGNATAPASQQRPMLQWGAGVGWKTVPQRRFTPGRAVVLDICLSPRAGAGAGRPCHKHHPSHFNHPSHISNMNMIEQRGQPDRNEPHQSPRRHQPPQRHQSPQPHQPHRQHRSPRPHQAAPVTAATLATPATPPAPITPAHRDGQLQGGDKTLCALSCKSLAAMSRPGNC